MMMQLELAASVVPQLLTSTKDAAPAPLSTIEVRLMGVVVLLLVTVVVCTALVVPEETAPKLSVVDDSVMAGAAAPVPLRVTDCVVGEALSVKTSVAVLLPATVGAKRTNAVQLAAAASEAGQLFTWLKEVGFVPPSATEEMVSALLPVLVSEMASAGL
jgi:hypothetical protein